MLPLKDRDRFHAWNPRHLRPVQNVMDPESLLRRIYVPRSHPFTRLEDLVTHNVREVDGVHRVRPGPTPPFLTRDGDGLKILGGLEVYRRWVDDDGGRSGNRCEGEDGWRDEMLFKRNWPMTEKNKARSLQEFIIR